MSRIGEASLLLFYAHISPAPPLELAGRYSCLGVNSSRTLGSLRSQQLWPHVGIMIHYLYHIGREGCPSIFIGFSDASNLIFPASTADWISLQNTLHSLVLCEMALCHLQYLWFLNSAADELYDLRIIWSVPLVVIDQRSGRPLWHRTWTSPFSF